MSSRPFVAHSSELRFGLLKFIGFKFTQLGLLLIWMLCVPSMGIKFYRKIKYFYKVQVLCGRGWDLEPLASCKVATRESRTEGSETAKLGIDPSTSSG
jgi:hypothetical protein